MQPLLLHSLQTKKQRPITFQWNYLEENEEALEAWTARNAGSDS
jgi:hypothetical protein